MFLIRPTALLCTAAAATALLTACATGPAPSSPGSSSSSSSSSSAAAAPLAGQPARPAGGHGIDAFLGSFDADRDGRVTRAEYDAIRAQRFRAADTNGDGGLSEDEYVAEYEARLKQQYFDDGRQPDAAYASQIKQAHVRYRIVNRARDGRYTPEEDRAVASRTFKGMDTNGDGVVSAADPQRPPPPRAADGQAAD
ncbi:EF-hand domain-containing protein [Acidovorax sp. Leaf160]|uniref:EF-hand domain-containing protein n=1 Tax=Acidovorax sp. Leaf160 TaxID=1736280 RepID=UPI0006F2552F|nr:EF-hand domain-containing protein [Acidovorax sp. Leaf160]KQR56788.1 hypothetical protein ASF94_18880 [Acidovorax sp. Leaf160]